MPIYGKTLYQANSLEALDRNQEEGYGAEEDGGRMNSYLVFEGIDSAVFSSRTDGYLDYRGLGWSSHVIIPKFHIFENDTDPDTYNISAEERLNSKIIPDINKETYCKVQDDKEPIQAV
jgi:hypothetical protein